jgi:uncharacterized C2H2 Zn-finger protein
MTDQDEQLRCPRCGSEFESNDELQTHLQTAHIRETPSEVDERLDEEGEQSFPASDPPSTGPVQGMGDPDNDD